MLRLIGQIEGSKAYIWGRVICKKLGTEGFIRFCIDTGASSTCLFERHAIAMRIDVSKLERSKERSFGVGGAVDVALLRDVQVRLMSEDGRGAVISFGVTPVLIQRECMAKRIAGIPVRFLRRRREPHEEPQKGLPALLGFDFLRLCKISFSADEVYLDID